MRLTAELSLYPLQDDFLTVIDDFIAEVRARDGMEIVTNAMSTQICGDYDQVFALVQSALRQSAQRHGKQVLVCKLIADELAIRQ